MTLSITNIDHKIARVEFGDSKLKDFDKQELTQMLQKEYPFESDFLPPNIRFLSVNRNIIGFERQAEYQTVHIKNTNGEGIPLNTNLPDKSYTIPIPKTFYIIILDTDFNIYKVFMYALSYNKYNGLQSQIQLLPLLNMYDNGEFCLPKTSIKVHSIKDAVNKAYSTIWHSEFNFHLTQSIRASQRDTEYIFYNKDYWEDADPDEEPDYVRITHELYEKWSLTSLDYMIDVMQNIHNIPHAFSNHTINDCLSQQLGFNDQADKGFAISLYQALMRS